MYYVKDQSNPDLDKWLKYNNPTVLKHGESLGQYKFTDNSKVKRDLEQEKKAKAETIKKNKAIAAQNKEREKLAKEKMQKIEKEHKTKQAIQVQSELLAPFYESARRADITRLSRLVNISSAYLRLCMTRKALSEEQLETYVGTYINTSTNNTCSFIGYDGNNGRVYKVEEIAVNNATRTSPDGICSPFSASELEQNADGNFSIRRPTYLDFCTVTFLPDNQIVLKLEYDDGTYEETFSKQ